MLYSGMTKLVGIPGMEESFLSWGYDRWFMISIGVIEVVLAILLFAKPTRNIALIGLILLTSGAIYTHLSNYEYAELGPAIWIMISSILMLGYKLLDVERMLNQKSEN